MLNSDYYSQASQEVAQFELLVERTLYTYLVKQIDVAWEKGIKYHVLGYEGSPFTFYPCISFFCGDNPCQHRISGLQEGNAKHGCVYCMYPTTSGAIYSPDVHRPRDAREMSRLCAIAEDITVVRMTSVLRILLTVDQKRVLSTLKFRNVHLIVIRFIPPEWVTTTMCTKLIHRICYTYFVLG